MSRWTGPALTDFGREEFLSERFRYRDGEHITIVGPTGCGKTWLAWDMLQRITGPRRPGVVLLKKPQDYTTDVWSRDIGYRRERTWPPSPNLWRGRPPGWVLHPRTAYDETVDRPHKGSQFRRALLDAYKRDKRRYPDGVVVFVDDAYGISELLKLRETLIELWTEMRSQNGGLMTGFQKPSHVPTWAYNMASHLLIFKDPDKRNRQRFGEIGGIDSDLVQDATMELGQHEALYIRRDGPAACIVRAE